MLEIVRQFGASIGSQFSRLVTPNNDCASAISTISAISSTTLNSPSQPAKSLVRTIIELPIDFAQTDSLSTRTKIEILAAVMIICIGAGPTLTIAPRIGSVALVGTGALLYIAYSVSKTLFGDLAVPAVQAVLNALTRSAPGIPGAPSSPITPGGPIPSITATETA
jgi:hypothetical protein